MNKDIRLKIGFSHNYKTQKLIKRIKKEGAYSLICFWLYVGENHPKGDISSLTNEDIAIAAGWEKDPDQLVNALIEVGFIDETIGDDGKVTRVVHDWAEHNPFAFYAPERSEIARQNVQKRWDKRKGKKRAKDNRIQTVDNPYAGGIHPEYQPDTPSPSPSPSPLPKHYEDSLQILSSIPNYPFDREKDIVFLREKEKDYPSVDILALLKGWKSYLLDKPLNGKSRPRSQLHNQFELVKKWGKHQKEERLIEPYRGPSVLDKIKQAQKELEGNAG
jgi:hypothetical protein